MVVGIAFGLRVGVGLGFRVGVTVAASKSNCESAEIIFDSPEPNSPIKTRIAKSVTTRRGWVFIFTPKNGFASTNVEPRSTAGAKSNRANKFAATHSNADLRRRESKRRRSLSPWVEAVSTALSRDFRPTVNRSVNECSAKPGLFV